MSGGLMSLFLFIFLAYSIHTIIYEHTLRPISIFFIAVGSVGEPLSIQKLCFKYIVQ